MNKFAPMVLTALFVLTSSPLAHATSLLDLFQLAVENDPALKAAQSSLQAGKEAHPLAQSQLLPTISAYGNIGKASHDVKDALPGIEYEKQVDNEMEFNLVISQPLFNMPAFRAQQAADIKLAQAELDYRIAQQDLIFRVADNYFSTLSVKEKLDIVRAQRIRLARLTNIVEKRFAHDEAEAIEALQAKARRDVLMAQEIKLENDLLTQRDQLTRISNTTHENLLAIKPNAPLIPPSPTSLDHWVEAAKSQNLSLLAKRLQADAEQGDMDIIRAKRYPTLAINAEYGVNDHGGAYPQKSVDAKVTLDLNMTLYNGNVSNSKLRIKKHNFDRIIHELEEKEREITQKTRSSYLGVLAGISYLKALNSAVNSSELVLISVSKDFESGKKNAIDLLNAQQQLFNNQLQLAASRYEYILNMLQLKQNIGLLTVDDLEQVNNWLQ